MAFRLDDFQKNTRFPEEGTPEFMVAMGNSLKAYDAALGLLIDVMELLRDSFMEVVEIHYGISAYEEFLKDNRAAEKAKEFGATVTYDPNYRANLWKSEAQAVGQMKSVLGKVDILKISDEELPLLTGTKDCEEGTRQLREQYGIPLILLTLGADGAFYRRGEETGKADGFKVKVADTNGAGDTFFGAFLSRMAALGIYRPADLSSEQLYESVRTANLAASITTSRHGAIPAMPDLKELEEKKQIIDRR